MKTAKINLYRYVAVPTKNPKDLQNSLCGVFHDPDTKAAVACNMFVLISDTTQYNPDLAGKIIDKKGNEIPIKYPSYRDHIPSDCDHALDLSAITKESVKEASKKHWTERHIDCEEVRINPRYASLMLKVGLDHWNTPSYKVGYGAIVKRTETLTVMVMPIIRPF